MLDDLIRFKPFRMHDSETVPVANDQIRILSGELLESLVEHFGVDDIHPSDWNRSNQVKELADDLFAFSSV